MKICRGYNKNDLDEIIINEKTLINNTNITVKNKVNARETVNFSTIYSAYLPNINKIFAEHHALLKKGQMEGILEEPPKVCYKRGKNCAATAVEFFNK